MNELADLFGLAPAAIDLFFMVFLRIGAAMFVLPAFGEMMVPLRVRLAVTLCFSFIAFPALLADFDPAALGQQPLLLRGLGEVATGLAIGLMLRFQIMAIQIAASIAAQSTSLAQLFGGANVDPLPAIGVVLYMAALALAVQLGLHVQFALMFIASYDVVAPGALIGTGLSGSVRDAVAGSFQFAFVLAAPFVTVSLLYNLALGVINRAMPQLMVAFVGAPAITYGALVLLAVTAPLLLAIWADQMQARILNPFGGR